MKKLIFLPLILLFFACGNAPDNERIIGKWMFNEVYEDGKLVATTDEAQQEKIVDEQLKQQEAMFAQMGIDKNGAKKTMLDRMKKMNQSGFEFTKKNIIEFSPEGKNEKQEYKLDEVKKTIVIYKNGKAVDAKETVKYAFEDDNLVLKVAKIKMVLVRK
jgi:hypothetical protein